MLIEHDPHLVIESTMLAGYAMQADICFVYIRGEYVRPAQVLEKAVDEAYAKGYVGKNILGSGWDCEFVVHRGAGAYICGEETALMTSLEGNRGYPRFKPPFPAAVRRVGHADHDQQHRDAGLRALDSRARPRVVRLDRQRREEQRPQALLPSAATSSGPGSTKSGWAIR